MVISQKKQKRLTPLEYLQGELGDVWIWMAFDPGSKVVVASVIGKRTLPQAHDLLHQVHEVAPAAIPYFTSDELEHYIAAIRDEYSVATPVPKTGKRGRPKKPLKVLPSNLVYAQVHKTRQKGVVHKIEKRVIFGTEAQVQEHLKQSPRSHAVNTSFVERHNLTMRQKNGRLQRKTLQFSKEKMLLQAQLDLFLGLYHFVRPHTGLTDKSENGDTKWVKRTPLMAAGITDHVWSFREFFSFKREFLNKVGN